ncbi:uncharacterized protein LOC106866470 [Brachypodium distachyon]|uniref:Uncharacterized protein n=1 Tax=Brachypodium distachyon TaxID=15368 RepID=A0A0Q3FJ46_BRADI|nr:uncharacterized protein LOC106866470 [Brachypodium distachyon]KQJ98108.1 hypothetical protein BRADI_3g34945v3 [Brachypodium distachyon]|eukprot:XP_014756214.1 uncharacterized protein LOC106866470 [Brachypodium distachyon]
MALMTFLGKFRQMPAMCHERLADGLGAVHEAERDRNAKKKTSAMGTAARTARPAPPPLSYIPRVPLQDSRAVGIIMAVYILRRDFNQQRGGWAEINGSGEQIGERILSSARPPPPPLPPPTERP